MAVATSAVQISINVVDANSGAAIAGVEQNLKKLGAAGASSGQQMKKGLEEAGGMALSAKEKTRLLSEEFGIRIPRAMQNIVAQSSVAKAALNGLTTGMIALGAVQIGGLVFGALLSGIEKVWERFHGLERAAEDYNAAFEKTKNEEFGNTHSIETTRLRINEAAASAKDFAEQAKKAEMETANWWQLLSVVAPGAGQLMTAWSQHGKANDLAKQGFDQQAISDRLAQVNLVEQQHDQREDMLKALQARRDADVQAVPEKDRALAKRNAEITTAFAEATEKQRFDNERDSAYGNHPAKNAGQGEAQLFVTTAAIKANNELASQSKKNNGDAKSGAEELARIHEEALESGLRGSALYHAQEAAAIDDLKRRGIATPQAINDVQAKFHNEEMKRLQEESDKVAHMREETDLAGKTGIARVQQEGQNKLADVYRNRAGLNPGEMLAEVKAIDDQTAQQIGELNKSFKERVDEIVSRSANRELQGFARIRADAQDQIRELSSQYQKEGGKPEDLARGVAGINAGAAGQAGELAQKNAQETAQIEEQARVKFMSAEKQKTAAIQSEYDERLLKYKQELASQEISQDDYNRRVAAAAQEANAETIQAATEARQKMAGEFDTLFKGMDHPLKMLEGLGDKVAGEAAASLVQRLQQRGQGGGGSTGSADTGLPQGILNDVLGGFGFGGKKKTPGAGGAPVGTPAGHAAHSTAQGAFSVQQATISVGSATFTGAGAGTGTGSVSSGATSSGVGAGWSSAGGSTPMLASGASGGSGGFVSSAGSRSGAGSGGGGPWTTPDFSAGAAGFSGGGSSTTGGAGAGGGAAGAPSFAGSGGGGQAPRGLLGGVMSDVSQGMGLTNQFKSIFGGGKANPGTGRGLAETQTPTVNGQFDKNGNFVNTSSTNTGMLGGGGIRANAGDAISGGLGMYSTVEGNGGVGGALQGAMSGMQLGGAMAGPIGAAIGAAAGAVVGAIGIGGREKARVYDLKNVRPKIVSDQDSYNQGGMAYSDVYQDFQGMKTGSWAAIRSMGPAAMSYWNDTIKPEIEQAQTKLTAEQRAGRSMYSASGAQYATGADSVPGTGMALVHQGERIFSTDQNERITQSIESAGRMPTQPAGWSGDIHIHAHDTQTGISFLMNNKHVIRNAMNASLAENSGGGL